MMDKHLEEILSRFDLPGETVSAAPYGNGHINATYRVVQKDGIAEKHYILQKINREAFHDPEAVIRNMEGVTSFLRKKIREKGGDPLRETMNLIPTKAGKPCYVNEQGDCYRITLFIPDTVCFEQVEDADLFYRSGKAFGQFQHLLADYPADQLTETIPDFHNTPKRFADFKRAVEQDVMGRAKEVQPEIAFLMEREPEYAAAITLQKAGKLPLRVTHNDTKLNNILFDKNTGEAVCVIDLDTVMPGLSIFDFGDSIRFGANTATEDERDLSKVSLSLPLYEAYVKGFLEGSEGSLTPAEVEMLPMGAKLMTLECGMRFLADYLQGDVYFKIERESHNLDRCRTQLALAADMERKWDSIQNTTKTVQNSRL